MGEKALFKKDDSDCATTNVDDEDAVASSMPLRRRPMKTTPVSARLDSDVHGGVDCPLYRIPIVWTFWKRERTRTDGLICKRILRRSGPFKTITSSSFEEGLWIYPGGISLIGVLVRFEPRADGRSLLLHTNWLPFVPEQVKR